MRHQSVLIAIPAILGTSLLTVRLLFWPNLSIAPTFDQQYLPESEDRAEPLPENSISLFFVGDIMLARGVEWRIGKEGLDYPLEAMVETISSANIAIGNFEGTIRETANVEPGSIMAFDTTPEIAKMIVDSGFDVLSLANNHGDDFGAPVAQYTRDTLTSLGAIPVGDPWASEDYIARIDQDGLALSFISYHGFIEDSTTIAQAITNEKAEGRYVIVLPHWGPEYTATPHTNTEVEPAHAFVDAGADLVIGGHPHVIQTIETYNGVPIIYSLGNFLFDQDWSIPTQQGMTALVTLTDNNITIDFATVNVTLQKTTPMTTEESEMLLATYDIPTSLTLPLRSQTLEE